MGSECGSESEAWGADIMERQFCTAVVLAAGQGKRMGTKVAKQYLEIAGRPLLYYTLRAFEQSPLIDSVVLVVGDQEQISYCKKEIIETYGLKKVDHIVLGGKERYDSVFCALREIEKSAAETAKKGYVFIHDGARPVVSEEILERCYRDVECCHACVAAVPVKDTIKIADEKGFAESTPRRDLLWQVQTPQAFEFSLIFRAYTELMENRERLMTEGIRVTDDAMVVETFTDKKVKLTEGAYENIKVTTPEDLVLAKAFLQHL